MAGEERWRTTNRYGGDRVHVDPPAGGTPTTTLQDVQGHTAELWQARDPRRTTGYDKIKYGYNISGQLNSVVDAAGNTWSFTYDLLGRKLKAVDPDAGTSEYKYDKVGRLTRMKTATGDHLYTTFDKLGRRTAVYLGDGDKGTKLAGWTYATCHKGQLSYSQRFDGGSTYSIVYPLRDHAYRPTTTRYVVPASEGKLAGSYEFTTTYNPDGTMQGSSSPVSGDLPAESLWYGYDELQRRNCWSHPNATIMLGGRSGELIKINENLWKLQDDDGSKIERLTGATNGDNDGEYWKVTTTDGTEYYFGQNRLPGWTGATGQEETRSVWTMPVYGDDANEPCNRTSGFTDSYCDQAWRWNLDYVKDIRGNVISYFYERETNHYARGFKTDVDGDAYHRGGYLRRIDYGERDNAVYTTDAPVRVRFDTAERCLPGGGVDCDPADLNDQTAASWPDVPFDLNCAAQTHCKPEQAAPSFWTRKRLTQITTEIRSGDAWSPIESWELTHEFKNNGDASRSLWLANIAHKGHQDGTTITLPSVDLVGGQMANRIETDPNISPLIRYRLRTIYTDSGAQIDINYKPTDCSSGPLPKPGESTKRCFPVRWNPLGTDEPINDWFHKYVVGEVVQTDRTGGNPDMVTRYDYDGDAAWRKTPPDGITKSEDLTWAEWRGYRNVTVRTGDVQTLHTRTDHVFLRGMDGDKTSSGGTRDVTVKDSTGADYVDRDEWAGHELETTVHNGESVLSKTINMPWLHHTATQTESWGTRRAYLGGTETTRTLEQLSPDAQGQLRWREKKTVTSHDTTWGRVTQVDDLGDISTPDDDKCTRPTYVDAPGRYLYSLESRSETVSVRCSVTSPNRATQLVSDKKTSYDGLAWGAAPTAGSPTRVEEIKSHDGTTATYVTTSESVVDGYGRVTSAKNALGHVTRTEYLETNGLTTQTKVKNPLDHETVTTIEPGFGNPTRVVDPNLKITDTEYDALGRLVRVWQPDRSKDAGQTPNVKYEYVIRKDKPVVIKTEKIKNDGTYGVGYQLFDGLLRPRQTQAQGPRGGWLLTDTYHSATGKIAKKNDAYFALGTPGDLPIVVPEGSVNGQTGYVYDAADRPTNEITFVAGDERWRTTTSYEGDQVRVDPPAGATPVTTVTNAQGKPTAIYYHHGTMPTGPADVTRYTYTPTGLLATVTDPAGNLWRTSYDLRGQKIRTEDPDAGTTVYGYDDLGQVTSTVDARGGTVSHVYDKLGRKTQTWQGAVGSGTKLAEWVYDTVAKGQLYYNARYIGGKTYGVVNATLDALYRPLKTSYVIPTEAGAGLAGTYDFTTVYNSDGTVQSVGLPAAGGLAGEAVVTSYDSLGRPTTVAGATPYANATSYADTGELLQLELNTGGKKTWLTYSHERGTNRLAGMRLERQGVATIDLDTRYHYDAAGNLLSVADTPANGPRDIQCFTYDHQRRLSSAWATDSADADPCMGGPQTSGVGGPAPYHLSWEFDAAGNRTRETEYGPTGVAPTVRTYTYAPTGSPRPHAVSRVEESGPTGNTVSEYDYDAAGNTIARRVASRVQAQVLTWDPEGHVASVTEGGQATSFVYDASGSRMLRKEPNATTLYLPGMELRLDLASKTVSGTRFYAFGGRTVAVRNSGGVHFQAADHHDTATCTIDATTGAINWRRTTPYGGSRGAQATTWPDEKGFVGGTRDSTTGLVHLGAREYDPATGRFLSVDPQIDFTDPQQINRYAYASNNPVGMTDPTGLFNIGKLMKKIIRNVRKTIKSRKTCTRNGYCVGGPREPTLEDMNDDFPYDPKQKPTAEDYRRKALAHLMLGACRGAFAIGDPVCSDMDDNNEEFNHYLDGDGSDWHFNLEEAYREDPLIRQSVDLELAALQRGAAELVKTTGLTSFQITGENHRWDGGAKTWNWQAALGSYNRWSSADVTVDGDKVTMKVTMHGVDRWNFNNGGTFMGIPDEYFGRLSVVGLAKNYTLRGSITREITFSLGGSTPPTVQGPPAPGRTQSEGNRCQRLCL
ncbi:RHS repeat-associated core domain-containing protein [Micromonospora polyrhachis]